MAFSVNTMTGAGVALAAAASASDRIIYTQVLSSESYIDAATASSATVGMFEGPAGGVISASATDTVARVVGSIRNARLSAVTLKSFALVGRLESGSEVVVAVLSDENAAVELPAESSEKTAASVAFSMSFSAGQAAMVAVTTAGSATVSDLARFVSLHKAGDPSSGDYQSVRGYKQFLDGIGASDASFSGTVTVSGMTGLQPTSLYDLPVGGLAVAWLDEGTKRYPGDIIYASYNQIPYARSITDSVIASVYYIPSGSYTPLMLADSSTGGVWCLLMRVG